MDNVEQTQSGPSPLFDIHCHCGLAVEGEVPAQPGERELIATAAVCHWQELLPHLDGARHRFGAVGLHPWYAQQWDGARAEQLEMLLTCTEIRAVGEVGLDPAATVSMAVQEQVLRAQIRIALKVGKPLILHVSKGYPDILKILKEERAERVGGVVHGFSTGANIGEAFIRQGFYLGIGPLLLRENVRKLPEALRHLPAEYLVLETDAQGGRGGYATPKQRTAILATIAHRLAELHVTTEAQMCTQLWRNSCDLLQFNSPKEIDR